MSQIGKKSLGKAVKIKFDQVTVSKRPIEIQPVEEPERENVSRPEIPLTSSEEQLRVKEFVEKEKVEVQWINNGVKVAISKALK